MAKRITTRLADMSLSDDGRTIEVQFRAGSDLDVDGLMEVQLRRGELTLERCAMLSFFEPGTLSELAVMNVDLFSRTKADEQLVALAIVVKDNLGGAMSGLYYGYHPQAFPTRIFREEAEARTWLAEELRRAGL